MMKKEIYVMGRLKRSSLSTSLFTQRFMRSVLLLLVMLSGGNLARAYVVGEYITKDNITYRVIDNSTDNPKLAVYNVKGVSGTVTIPSNVFDGKDVNFTVTQIGGGNDNDPIKWDATITAVKLPKTITTISNYSFAFSSITSLTIPASVTTIVEWANVLLGRCYKLKEILVEDGNPNFISDDGVLYTKGHEELICVPIAKDFSSAGNCYTINGNTKKIRVDAIGETTTLQKLVIPASVNNIYMDSWPTFAYTPTYLKEIEVDANNATYCSVDGVVYSKDKTKLIYYPGGKEDATFKVPDGVTSIPNGFSISWNKHLTTIDFNQVENLGEFAISACYKLKVINIPKTLTSIGDAAFSIFANLEKYVVDPDNPNYSSDTDGVLFNKDKTQLLAYPPGREGEYTIPNSVTQIGEQAFLLARITTITIPSKVSDLGYESFRATKLKTVLFEEPSKITSLKGREFLWCNDLKTVTLPKSLKTLGNAFSGCTNLETVNVPDGSQLEEIRPNSFVACENLTDFKFLGSCNLKTIGFSAFADMTKLKEFNFPASVTDIGVNAFGNTPAMEKVTFDDNITMISFGQGAFSNSGIKSIKIPASVKSIDKDAFKNCNVLERVTVPAGCIKIHPEAFKYDTKLADIDVDEANTVYSSVQGILLNKEKSTLLIFPSGKARTDFTLLPPSITSIGDYAFYEGSPKFTNIVIPAKVNNIGRRAFGLNPALRTVTLLCDEMIPSTKIDQGANTMSFDDGTVASDNAADYITVYVRKHLLAQYKADPFWSKFELKPSFTVNAEGTSASTDEYIPTSETAVDFLSTTADVRTFVLPKAVVYDDGVTSKTYNVRLIGDYAFENANPNMKEVVVKADVDYIGAMAFVTKTEREVVTNTITPVSTTIKQVIFTGNTPATEMSHKYFSLEKEFSEFFCDNAGNCLQNIFVKKSKLDAYKTAWSDYASALDYKIKGDGASDLSITKKFVTFSREFDVDFGDTDDSNTRLFWDTDKDCPKVIAYDFGSERKYMSGNGEEIRYVYMYSINVSPIPQDKAKDGLYVPAESGVVLEAIDGTLPADFYYRIGEDDMGSHSSNVMHAVTVNPIEIPDVIGTNTCFYLSEGKAFKVSQSRQFKAEGKLTVGAHKAYMLLNLAEGPSKVIMGFKYGADDPTSVESTETVVEDEAAWYDLQGRRVAAPAKGIYIHNGKKVVVK